MKIKELIKILQSVDPDSEVTVRPEKYSKLKEIKVIIEADGKVIIQL